MVNLKLSMQIQGAYEALRDVANARQEVNLQRSLALLSGTAAGQADLFFADTRTLSASGTEDLDLAGGLTDAFGATLTHVEVVGLLISAAPGNTNNVLVGGAASNAWGAIFGAANDVLVLKPGASFFLMCDAGYAVTAGTGDLLKVANSGAGTGVTYTIAVIGRSA
jgi:hypothetical protein